MHSGVEVGAGLSLGDIGSEDHVVTGQDHLKELSIAQSPILVDVEVAHNLSAV